MKRILVTFIVLLVAVFVTIPPAMLSIMTEFKVLATEQAVDSLPPSAPVLRLENIWRGHGAVQIGDLMVENAEGRFGSISLSVFGAKDDRTAEDSLGYRFRHVSGELPRGLALPPKTYFARIVRTEKRLWFYWDDDATWDQDSIVFKIAVIAVDRGGNESPPSNVVEITHNGDLTEFHQKWIRMLERDLRKKKAIEDSLSTLRN